MDVSRIEKPEIWIDFYKIMDRLNAKREIYIEHKYSNKIEYVSRLFESVVADFSNFLDCLDLQD